MQVGKLGAAARKTMRPFFVWWVARCFLSIGLWGFGPVGQICKCSKYTSVYMYMYLCLFVESWVFHGIQGNTPGAAHGAGGHRLRVWRGLVGLGISSTDPRQGDSSGAIRRRPWKGVEAAPRRRGQGVSSASPDRGRAGRGGGVAVSRGGGRPMTQKQ